MKFTKTVVAITMIAILFSMLCGCEKEEISVSPASLLIEINSGSDFTDELMEHISDSKNEGGRDGHCDGLYLVHKISDIEGFYCLDNLKIDGYELYLVEITEYSFHYYYALTEKLNEEESYWFSSFDGIEITVDRPHWVDTSNPMEVIIERAGYKDWDYRIEDGVVYYPNNGGIDTQIDDTRFRISVPDELNTYEYLRDLAFEVIKTAELIDVERELARMERG